MKQRVIKSDGRGQSKQVAVCELKVVTDSNGVPWDEVHGLLLKEIGANGTIDHTNDALAVAPYRISPDPRGALPIPHITQPGPPAGMWGNDRPPYVNCRI